MSRFTEIKYLHSNTNDKISTLKNYLHNKLPYPPSEWMHYNETTDKHIETGKKDFNFLFQLLKKHNFILSEKKILEFGCNNSRVLRHFEAFSDKNEIWGCDINSRMITWCLENLSPPFNYFTNTTQPHLPFKDGFFDLIYAYSIFTHIDDLFFTWILELSRNLRSTGFLFISIHDENSVNFGFNNPERLIGRHILKNSDEFKAFLKGENNMVTVNRKLVFIKRNYFKEKLQTLGFSVIDFTNYTMGNHQTAFLLQKKN